MAMSVLYARQVLTALLADWPSTGHVITAELIGCKKSAHVPFVLDLLNTPEASESFQKVHTFCISTREHLDLLKNLSSIDLAHCESESMI